MNNNNNKKKQWEHRKTEPKKLKNVENNPALMKTPNLECEKGGLDG